MQRSSNLTSPPPAGLSSANSRMRPVTGRVVQPVARKQPANSTTLWNHYDYTKPPVYPDTSYGAFLREGGNLLGIGYIAWKNKKIADYQTAYQLYQQYYDSASSQLGRIAAAGLNTNLAYGSITPGGSAGSAPQESQQAPTTMEVASQASGVLGNIIGGAKTLAEAATIIAELPESKFKGNLAKSLDVAAAAQGINAENLFKGQLNQALVDQGVGRKEAGARGSKAVLQKAQQEADKNLLDYITSHDAEGSESSFEGSLFSQSGQASQKDAILSYQKHKKEWDALLSDPAYYKSLLKKAIADGDISYAQAWKVNQILNDPNMDNASKVIALQEGLPGFFAKVAFSISSKIQGGLNSAGNWIRGLPSAVDTIKESPWYNDNPYNR